MGSKENGSLERPLTLRRNGTPFNQCDEHSKRTDESLPLSVTLKTYGGPLRDFSTYWIQWMFVTALVIFYLLIVFLLEVPGCGKGYIGPGGIGDSSQFQNCTGGALGYIDKLLLGIHHMNAVFPFSVWPIF
jgi:hypothetical protein